MKKNTQRLAFDSLKTMINNRFRLMSLVIIIVINFSCTVAYVPTYTPNVPDWAPSYSNINKVQYYYLPDLECYYDVAHHEFIYLEDNKWMFTSSLPSAYEWYDLNNCFTVVLDVRVNEPWKHFSYYVSHYPRYYYRTTYRSNYNRNEKVWGFNENDRSPLYMPNRPGTNAYDASNQGQSYPHQHHQQTYPQSQYNSSNNQGYEQGYSNQQYNQYQNGQPGIPGPPQHQSTQQGYSQGTTAPAPHNPQQGGQTQSGQNNNGQNQGGQQGNTAPVPHNPQQGGQSQGGQNNGQNQGAQQGTTAPSTNQPVIVQPHSPVRSNFPDHPIKGVKPAETQSNPPMNQNHPPVPPTQVEQPHAPNPNHVPEKVVNVRPAESLQYNDKNVGKPVKVKKEMMRQQPTNNNQ